MQDLAQFSLCQEFLLNLFSYYLSTYVRFTKGTEWVGRKLGTITIIIIIIIIITIITILHELGLQRPVSASSTSAFVQSPLSSSSSSPSFTS
jgi:hypothetical protein